MAHPRGSEATDGARAQQHAGLLVPLLRLDEGLGDPVALATWHEALSDALAADLPHDLLGLWLYPTTGEVVLLGPSALAADDLAVPLPAPQLDPGQLDHLAEIVRVAGYGSTACVSVRFGKRDVGLLLVADLRPDRFGEVELLLLRSVAQRLAPLLGRMARQWGSAHGSATYQLERVAGLL
jgi:GAF domain-containing protein